MSTAALTLEQVTARRGGAPVFASLSFEVAPKTIHALVGPNGAGKSTLLECVLGLHPFEGRIARADGALGYVPQTFRPDASLSLTVQDFLALGRTSLPVCLGVGSRVRARVDSALAMVGLAGFAARSVHALSGGELRRVLLADALERAPALLLLDEPWAGLDEAAAKTVEDALRAHRDRGGAALVVTHDAAQVERLADARTQLARGSLGA